MRTITSWDLFCRVVDNYGDIGVAWRLARQLVREHALDVRLFVDALTAPENERRMIEHAGRLAERHARFATA